MYEYDEGYLNNNYYNVIRIACCKGSIGSVLIIGISSTLLIIITITLPIVSAISNSYHL